MRQAREQQEREQKAEEERAKRIEHEQHMVEWRAERAQLIQQLNPAYKVMDYVQDEVEGNREVQKWLLKDIERKNTSKFTLVETEPWIYGGRYSFHFGLQEPKLMYAGTSVDVNEEEYTTAFVQSAPHLQRTIQRGPFQDWRLSVQHGGRLFGMFGSRVHIILQQRRWYHWWW